ncbi:MAG: 4Fe-4S dicluster domain-containing protein [Actinomycetia bacterium]|nr:4Fe-4S dicluster domain-containing protein [Actinomycetes bacterium]
MAIKYLKADALPALLEALAKNARVVAPFKRDGVVQFEPWQSGKDVELDVLLAKQSPKEWVFPQCETYLKFGYRMEEPAQGATAGTATGAEGEAIGGEGAAAVAAGAEPAIPHETVEVEALNEAPAQVIFGLRPCDARGFVQMDQVFGGYGGFYFDPLYNSRRAVTTLLAVTCRDPRSTCFCTALGGCPAGQEGVDALFTQVEGGFVVEPLTEKGEAVVGTAGGDLGDATEAQAAEANAVKAEATGKVDVPFALEGIRDHLHDNIDDPGWHDLCMRCISCGTCTYVCPNCYCFSINDELVESEGERYRVWDNCFNPLYTEETSGHNPRAQKSNRFRNRFSHKFWYYPDKYDSLLCTGCGRCIMHCPTRIDIREVLRIMGAAPGAAAERAATTAVTPAATGAPTGAPAPTDGKEA